MGSLIDITGKRFGKLTVIQRESNHGQYTMWKCLCDCGNYHITRGQSLLYQETKSCGCIKLTRFGEITGEYWATVRKGARVRNFEFNITIKYAWDLFLKQERKCALSSIDLQMGNKYKGKETTASLDRIDSKLGYIEGNVQWIHKDINKMKNNFLEDKFIYYCNLISQNHQSKMATTNPS